MPTLPEKHHWRTIATRLLTGTSLAALAVAPPALAQTALPPVQVQGDETGSYTATSFRSGQAARAAAGHAHLRHHHHPAVDG